MYGKCQSDFSLHNVLYKTNCGSAPLLKEVPDRLGYVVVGKLLGLFVPTDE